MSHDAACFSRSRQATLFLSSAFLRGILRPFLSLSSPRVTLRYGLCRLPALLLSVLPSRLFFRCHGRNRYSRCNRLGRRFPAALSAGSAAATAATVVGAVFILILGHERDVVIDRRIEVIRLSV